MCHERPIYNTTGANRCCNSTIAKYSGQISSCSVQRLTIVKNRVGGWTETVEAIAAFSISSKNPSKVILGLVLVLHVVQSVRGCLPDIDGGVCDWLSSVHVEDLPVEEDHLASPVVAVYDTGAVFAPWSISLPEGSFSGRVRRHFTRLRFEFMSNLIDKPGHPSAFVSLRCSITNDSMPRTSCSTLPSFLSFVLHLPASFRSSTPCIHSSMVRLTSRAKS